MKYVKGDLRDRLHRYVAGNTQEFFIATTNADITKNGLVMGKGIALLFSEEVPGIKKLAAETIKSYYHKKRMVEVLPELVIHRPEGGGPEFRTYGDYYGFLPVLPDFGIFQTKLSWRLDPLLFLIEFSLQGLADYMQYHRGTTFHLPLPGGGKASWGEERVRKLIEERFGPKDRLYIWELN